MGVLGWTELADQVFLEGAVERVAGNVADDGDWCFHVRPRPVFASFLTANGRTNADGLIECEVEPPDRIGGDRHFHHYMDRLAGRWVRVVGTWAVDLSHGDKTEIHPITSILMDAPRPAGVLKRLELFAFSDSSGNFPAHVPHSNESRTATFEWPIGPVETEVGATSASFEVSDELDMSADKSMEILEVNGNWVFGATVASGTESDGNGFYHATVDLHYSVSKAIAFHPDSLWFGTVDVGESETRPLDIHNGGTSELSVSVPAPPAGSLFKWRAWEGTIDPGGSHRVSVAFEHGPTARPGRKTGGMAVISDTPGSPNRIALAGIARSPDCGQIRTSILHARKELDALTGQLGKAQRGTGGRPSKTLQKKILSRRAELSELGSLAAEKGCVPGIEPPPGEGPAIHLPPGLRVDLHPPIDVHLWPGPPPPAEPGPHVPKGGPKPSE